jgi:hypothetical protein
VKPPRGVSRGGIRKKKGILAAELIRKELVKEVEGWESARRRDESAKSPPGTSGVSEYG